MMISEIQLLYLLLGATSLLTAASGLAVVRFQRKMAEPGAFRNRGGGSVLPADAAAPAEELREVGRALAEMRGMLASLAKPDRVPAAPVFGEPRLAHAVLLAKQGASVRDLTECCSVSSGEAELLRRLHAPRSH